MITQSSAISPLPVQPEEEELAPISALKRDPAVDDVEEAKPRSPFRSRHSRIAHSPSSTQAALSSKTVLRNAEGDAGAIAVQRLIVQPLISVGIH
jgi:hypothetical protein